LAESSGFVLKLRGFSLIFNFLAEFADEFWSSSFFITPLELLSLSLDPLVFIEAEFPNFPIAGTLLLIAYFSGYYSPILKIGDSSFKLMFLIIGFYLGVIIELVCYL
jgi:hypothetical protein